jgi:hypothetical protein
MGTKVIPILQNDSFLDTAAVAILVGQSAFLWGPLADASPTVRRRIHVKGRIVIRVI